MTLELKSRALAPTGSVCRVCVPQLPPAGPSVEPQFEGAPVTGCAALVAAAAAGRTIVPLGSTLKVYWAGSDEWFNTKIIGHRAALKKGRLAFKHQCEYDGGFLEHDLGVVDYEIIERVKDQESEDEFNYASANKLAASIDQENRADIKNKRSRSSNDATDVSPTKKAKKAQAI